MMHICGERKWIKRNFRLQKARESRQVCEHFKYESPLSLDGMERWASINLGYTDAKT